MSSGLLDIGQVLFFIIISFCSVTDRAFGDVAEVHKLESSQVLPSSLRELPKKFHHPNSELKTNYSVFVFFKTKILSLRFTRSVLN